LGSLFLFLGFPVIDQHPGNALTIAGDLLRLCEDNLAAMSWIDTQNAGYSLCRVYEPPSWEYVLQQKETVAGDRITATCRANESATTLLVVKAETVLAATARTRTMLMGIERNFHPKGRQYLSPPPLSSLTSLINPCVCAHSLSYGLDLALFCA
jgi:hypothetical protein